MILQKKLIPLSEIIGKSVYYIDYNAVDNYIDEAQHFLHRAPEGTAVHPLVPGPFFKEGFTLNFKHGLVTVIGSSEKVSLKDIVFAASLNHATKQIMAKVLIAAIKARLYRGKSSPLFMHRHNEKNEKVMLNADLYAYTDPNLGDRY